MNGAIRTLHPSIDLGIQRIDDLVGRISRRGRRHLHVDGANIAVSALIHLVYESDSSGMPVNVDENDYRILIPVPWGRMGGAEYGLSWSEGEVLRLHVNLLIVDVAIDAEPLFRYKSGWRQWFLNAGIYQTVEAADDYWRHFAMTLDSYRECERKLPNMRKRRRS
jgi:hypothetical protein